MKYQEDEIKAYCEEQGLNLKHIFRDEGISGAKLNEEAPDAKPHDLFWSIKQLVTRRNTLVKAQGCLKEPTAHSIEPPLSKL